MLKGAMYIGGLYRKERVIKGKIFFLEGLGLQKEEYGLDVGRKM
jgi:hypothetical protein